MILLKPKLSTYISLGAVLFILLLGLVLILRDFAYSRSYDLWFYLVASSLLTLVLLMLLVKMMAGWRFITAGKEHVVIKLPLRGSTKVYPVAEILACQQTGIQTSNPGISGPKFHFGFQPRARGLYRVHQLPQKEGA